MSVFLDRYEAEEYEVDMKSNRYYEGIAIIQELIRDCEKRGWTSPNLVQWVLESTNVLRSAVGLIADEERGHGPKPHCMKCDAEVKHSLSLAGAFTPGLCGPCYATLAAVESEQPF